MTNSDKQWLSDVASLGCVVCRNLNYGPRPAEIHHVRIGQGTAQRASHKKVIPLCPDHHRTGGYGVAFHAGKNTWQIRYGSEEVLLAQTINDVQLFRDSIIGRAS